MIWEVRPVRRPVRAQTPEGNMTEDEKAIRKVIETWLAASQRGDVETVLGLMADDVVFLVTGQRSFGKEQFAESFRAMTERGGGMQARSEVLEIVTAGEWAWCRTELSVTMTPPAGAPVRRRGPTLTILRKGDSGWLVARDANMLAPEGAG
jgi:uncharacterized protein (TIGR02246 family)